MPSWVDDVDAERETDITELSNSTISQAWVQPRRRAVVVRLDGIHAGQMHALDEAALTIGRHPKNRLHIEDPEISRFHARLYSQEGEFILEDLDSRNGSFIEDRRCRIAKLRDGNIITLGKRVRLRFSLADAHQVQLMRRLYESSTYDALTEAHNRKHFDERLRAELAFAQRHSTSVALLLIDVDDFKQVNDTHGHTAGDAVLRQVAKAVRSRLRTEDLFARFGGEEFAVMLRGVQLDGAARLAERLRTTVARHPAVIAGEPIPVTISIGCATQACCSIVSPEELIEVADRRLYGAKRSGRNRVVYKDE